MWFFQNILSQATADLHEDHCQDPNNRSLNKSTSFTTLITTFRVSSWTWADFRSSVKPLFRLDSEFKSRNNLTFVHISRQSSHPAWGRSDRSRRFQDRPLDICFWKSLKFSQIQERRNYCHKRLWEWLKRVQFKDKPSKCSSNIELVAEKWFKCVKKPSEFFPPTIEKKSFMRSRNKRGKKCHF